MNSLASDFSRTRAPCTVDVIRDLAGLDALQADWNVLYATSPTAAPPLRWEWVRTWWQVYGNHYGDRGRGLRIVTVRHGPQLIGILPLYLGRKGNAIFGHSRLGFISTGAAEFEETGADYLDILHAPGEAEEVLQALYVAINCSSAFRWDELRLSYMSMQSPLVSLANLSDCRNWRVTHQGTCYRSDLSEGFETYLSRLSAGARAEARKLLREVQRYGMNFDVAADAQQADLFFSQMVELHQRRWQKRGKTGSFAPRHAEFHRMLARLLVPHEAALLARLSLGEKPFAVTYGHRVGHMYHCIQRGVSCETQPIRSPGTATLLLLMAYLSERGVTCYDHLMGTSFFKERYTMERHNIVELRAMRPTFRSAISFVADFARRGTHKVHSLIRRAVKRT